MRHTKKQLLDVAESILSIENLNLESDGSECCYQFVDALDNLDNETQIDDTVSILLIFDNYTTVLYVVIDSLGNSIRTSISKGDLV